MSWYVYSIIAVLTMACFEICQKWALNLKINQNKLLLQIFGGLFVAYFLFNLKTLPTLFAHGNFSQFLILGLLVATFSFLGNIFSVRATALAPNPGYVGAVKSTNNFLVVIGAFVLFGSPVTLAKMLGVVVILIGLFPFVLTTKSPNEVKHNNWFGWALLATLMFAGMILMVRYMTNLGFKTQEVLMILFFFGFIGFYTRSLINKSIKSEPEPEMPIILPVILAIIFSFVGNLTNFTAIKLAPNPGFATAIVSSSLVLTTIIARLVFPSHQGGEFNLKKWLGVTAVVIGVVIIVLG